MLLTWYVDGLQARLQCVSGVVISLLTSVGQGLVPRCHCVSGIASHAPTQHFSVLPHNPTPIYGRGFRCGWVPPPLLAKCSHQCSYQQKGRLARCVVSGRVLPLLLKCPSVSPQLFREVRIMKILNHPNIGEFRREHAAAFFDSSATLLQFSSVCTRNQHNLPLQVQKFRKFCILRCEKKKNKKTFFGIFFHLHHSVMSHTPTSRDTLMKAEEFAETCQGNKILKDL